MGCLGKEPEVRKGKNQGDLGRNLNGKTEE